MVEKKAAQPDAEFGTTAEELWVGWLVLSWFLAPSLLGVPQMKDAPGQTCTRGTVGLQKTFLQKVQLGLDLPGCDTATRQRLGLETSSG